MDRLTRGSEDASGNELALDSLSPTISADGNFVAFVTSQAEDSSVERAITVWVKDVLAGSLQPLRLSFPAANFATVSPPSQLTFSPAPKNSLSLRRLLFCDRFNQSDRDILPARH